MDEGRGLRLPPALLLRVVVSGFPSRPTLPRGVETELLGDPDHLRAVLARDTLFVEVVDDLLVEDLVQHVPVGQHADLETRQRLQDGEVRGIRVGVTDVQQGPAAFDEEPDVLFGQAAGAVAKVTTPVVASTDQPEVASTPARATRTVPATGLPMRRTQACAPLS